MSQEKQDEIATLKAAIKILKRDWGGNCPDLDENWWADGGCASCRAKKTIEFIKDHIKMAEDEL
jgi:hypothetical protein